MNWNSNVASFQSSGLWEINLLTEKIQQELVFVGKCLFLFSVLIALNVFVGKQVIQNIPNNGEIRDPFGGEKSAHRTRRR